MSTWFSPSPEPPYTERPTRVVETAVIEPLVGPDADQATSTLDPSLLDELKEKSEPIEADEAGEAEAGVTRALVRSPEHDQGTRILEAEILRKCAVLRPRGARKAASARAPRQCDEEPRYQLVLGGVTYEGVDRSTLNILVRDGLLTGSELIACGDDPCWQLVSEHPLFEAMRVEKARRAHALLHQRLEEDKISWTPG